MKSLSDIKEKSITFKKGIYFFLFLLGFVAVNGLYTWNFLTLRKNLKLLFQKIVRDEASQIYNLFETTLLTGGDPIESLDEYIKNSFAIKMIKVEIENHTPIVIKADNSTSKDLLFLEDFSEPPFRISLYYSREFLFFLERKLFLEYLVNLLISNLAMALFFYFIKKIYESRLLIEREKAEIERLESINLVLRQVLHEIKNSLNTINLALYRLKEVKQKEVKVIQNEVKRLEKKLFSMAEFFKRPILNIKRVEIKDLLEEVLEEFEEFFRSFGISLNAEIKKCEILGDKEKLKEVFRNIIKNACEALLEASQKRDFEKKIEVLGKVSGKFYIVRIKDNAGLLQEGDNPFRPYQSRKKGGFGIGLYYSKQIIESHKAQIKAFKEKDFTIFEIKFPLK